MHFMEIRTDRRSCTKRSVKYETGYMAGFFSRGIACGRFDAYHHNGLKPWDNAAAFLIIREAGGVVETLTGENAAFTSATVLAGTPGAVRDLRDIFRHIDPALLK